MLAPGGPHHAVCHFRQWRYTHQPPVALLVVLYEVTNSTPPHHAYCYQPSFGYRHTTTTISRHTPGTTLGGVSDSSTCSQRVHRHATTSDTARFVRHTRGSPTPNAPGLSPAALRLFRRPGVSRPSPYAIEEFMFACRRYHDEPGLGLGQADVAEAWFRHAARLVLRWRW